jgi:hypothetical protein
LAPVDVRAVSQVNDVGGVDKETAYSHALVWFQNNHDRAGIRITSNDPATATITGSGDMQCNSSLGAGLRGMGLGFNQNYLRFNVQFQAKDGRYKVTLSELFYYLMDIRYASSNLQQGPANQTEVDLLYRDCLKDLEASLMQTVAGQAAGSDF